LLAAVLATLVALAGCSDSGSDPASDGAPADRETLTTRTAGTGPDDTPAGSSETGDTGTGTATGSPAGAGTSTGAVGDVARKTPGEGLSGEVSSSPPSATRRPVERKTGGPSIHFFHLTHDFGKIYEGANVKTKFEFVNAGDKPLVISRVKTSCGCTVAAEPEGEIAPGESDVIEVAFNSKKRAGHQHKDISVFSNDPEQPMLKLRIEGEVVKQFWVDPERLFLGNMTKSAAIEDKIVKVLWADELDLEVTEVTPSHPAIKVTQAPLEDERGVELTLSFGDAADLVTRTNTASPRISQTIDVKTNDENFETRILVTGALIPEVHVRPGVLSFGVVGRGSKPVTKRVIVTAAKDFELQPPTVECDLDYLTFEVQSIRSGTQYQVEATLNPAAAPEGQFRETVIVRTNSEDFAENRIPVFGKIRE